MIARPHMCGLGDMVSPLLTYSAATTSLVGTPYVFGIRWAKLTVNAHTATSSGAACVPGI